MGKKSFILHIDSLSILDELTDEQAGKLFKSIYSFQTDLSLPDDPIIKLVFTPFKNQFVRDNNAYTTICEKKSYDGKMGNLKRWHHDLYLQVIENELSIDDAMQLIKESHPDSTQSHPDSTQSGQSQTSLKNDSKSDNDNKYQFDFVIFLKWFNETTGRKYKTIPDKVKRSYIQRLKDGYSKNDIMEAIRNCNNDEFHKNNPKYLTPEFMSRPDKIEMYLNAKPKKVEIPEDWWDAKLSPEQFKLLTPEQQKNKKLHEQRKQIGI